MLRSVLTALFVVLCGGFPRDVARAQETESRTDYLSFAQGAIPVRVGGTPDARTGFEHAVSATDGSPSVFSYTSLIDPALPVELVYELPAPTTFDHFAVPNVLETPSPSQTFVRDVEVQGSATSPDEGFVTLATGTLETHPERGRVTTLTLADRTPVRWVKLVLRNGIDVQRERMFLEFSEIIGNGSQEATPEPREFAGGWRGRGVGLLLRQDGVAVTGCYDRSGDLEGTVSGRILRATGRDRNTGVGSAFVALIGDNGAMQGVRSTNGAPFRLFAAETIVDVGALQCPEPAAPRLGCGAVIHGVQFAFDSAALTPESDVFIAKLHEGLSAETAGTTILIEGHTSSEGAETYNQRLSEQRAAAVVAALVARGLPQARLVAAGVGESRPIAGNDDETGRSLNRRVEVHCTAQ